MESSLLARMLDSKGLKSPEEIDKFLHPDLNRD